MQVSKNYLHIKNNIQYIHRGQFNDKPIVGYSFNGIMRFTTSRVLIFLLFAIWIGGMLYFFTSSSSVEPLSPREHQRLVQEGKKARERDHQNHNSDKRTVDKKYDFENNIVIAKDPKQRQVLNRDTRRIEDYDWKGYVKRGALKPGEDKNKRNAYNQEASEKLAWDRAIPDVRDSKYVFNYTLSNLMYFTL